jgi:hypothetical protein
MWPEVMVVLTGSFLNPCKEKPDSGISLRMTGKEKHAYNPLRN